MKGSDEGLITVAVAQSVPASKARGVEEARPDGRMIPAENMKRKPISRASEDENGCRVNRRAGLEFDFMMTILRSLVVNPEGWQVSTHLAIRMRQKSFTCFIPECGPAMAGDYIRCLTDT
jgi:hypothetical protein